MFFYAGDALSSDAFSQAIICTTRNPRVPSGVDGVVRVSKEFQWSVVVRRHPTCRWRAISRASARFTSSVGTRMSPTPVGHDSQRNRRTVTRFMFLYVLLPFARSHDYSRRQRRTIATFRHEKPLWNRAVAWQRSVWPREYGGGRGHGRAAHSVSWGFVSAQCNSG